MNTFNRSVQLSVFLPAYGSNVKLQMYCKTGPSRCGVSNTGHSRGDTECYEVSSSEVLITKVEHLEEPMKYQTDSGSFLICI